MNTISVAAASDRIGIEYDRILAWALRGFLSLYTPDQASANIDPTHILDADPAATFVNEDELLQLAASLGHYHFPAG